ncbi:hypothetical protein DVH05_015074 [Phytophthora capsici]|nr:hypothetical protein DVH05_015581 [Phytophthora capsici]KAG1683488.1 hypothetical protein DVH05_015074 [Phytophthora capsici]
MADDTSISDESTELQPCAVASSDPTTSSEGTEVDQYGIPVSVTHSNQNMFTAVWAYIHLLADPIPDLKKPTSPYTHICLVCAKAKKTLDPTSNAWKSCLMRQKTSSNAQKHMVSAHKDHPFTLEITQVSQKATTSKIRSFDASTTNSQQKTKKQRTIQETFGINRDEMRILSSRWLLSSGLPYTTLKNEELLNLLRRLSNDTSLILPAREAFYSFADGDYHNFVQLTSRTLKNEFNTVFQLPFLSMLHDLATNAANINIVAATIVFIDSKWRLRTLSLLALANSSGHAATRVANLIKTSIQARYDIDMDQYSRFTVSDTTGSARNVGDHFSSTDQVDCLMHLLSLCILNAVGLKENTRNDGQEIVTPGGGFRKGYDVIKKLRDIATFFNSPQRLQKLKDIKKLYNLPSTDIKVDAKTRVGYAVSLMRRSVYNYYALTKYFESAPANEQNIEGPSMDLEQQIFRNDLGLEAKNSWNHWNSLSVDWPGVTTNGGKYNALLLYRQVDVLTWFKDHGASKFPAVAILARIYLAKPLSTAIQERFFSLSSYVVNPLRTRLEDKRAEMLCLMKANWREYKTLLKEDKIETTDLA